MGPQIIPCPGLYICSSLNLILQDSHFINGSTSMRLDPDKMATAKAVCEAV